MAYDINGATVRSFFIERIKDPYLLRKRFQPSDELLDILKIYCEEPEYDEYAEIVIKEMSYDEED